jgi:competence protein ComFB
MKVHNIQEEEVFNCVDKTYEMLKDIRTTWFSCDCEQCRADVSAYVLNKVTPKYIVSGRGVNYNKSSENTQDKADLEALVMEAIRIVSSVKRPFHNQNEVKKNEETAGPAFNFPTFMGTVYDGTTFEPLVNAKVTLKYKGKNAQMMDHTWTNPYITDKRTKASYTFWVKPISASKENETAVFSFIIEVNANGYDKTNYMFNVPLISQENKVHALNTTYSLKIQDLFLFPKK